MNLTPLRLRALRVVHQQPGINAQALAYELVDRPWHPQAATRWGTSYIAPMIAAGYLSTRRADAGCWRLYLTAKAQETLREAA